MGSCGAWSPRSLITVNHISGKKVVTRQGMVSPGTLRLVDRADVAQEIWRAICDLFFSAENQSRFMGTAEEVGLTPPMLKALLELDPDEAKPMRALADDWGCDASFVTVVVDGLEHRGYARRLVATHDRRVKTVELTDQGRAVRAQAEEAVYGARSGFWELESDEQVTLARLLRKLADAQAGYDESVRREHGRASGAATWPPPGGARSRRSLAAGVAGEDARHPARPTATATGGRRAGNRRPARGPTSRSVSIPPSPAGWPARPRPPWPPQLRPPVVATGATSPRMAPTAGGPTWPPTATSCAASTTSSPVYATRSPPRLAGRSTRPAPRSRPRRRRRRGGPAARSTSSRPPRPRSSVSCEPPVTTSRPRPAPPPATSGGRCAERGPGTPRARPGPAGSLRRRWASTTRTWLRSGPPPTSSPSSASTCRSGRWAPSTWGAALSTATTPRRSRSTARRTCTTASGARSAATSSTSSSARRT